MLNLRISSLLAALCLIAAPALAAPKGIPNLVGTWICTGTSASHVKASQTSQFGEFTTEVRIETQEDSRLLGVQVEDWGGELHELPLVGAISRDHKRVVLVEAGGMTTWQLKGKKRAEMDETEFNESYVSASQGVCTKQAK